MTHLIKIISAAAIAASLAACATYDDASTDSMSKSETIMKADVPMVGGAAMLPSKTIVENASAAPNLTTLVSAVKQAQLVETLETLTDLQKVLTAHVVPGTISASDLMEAISTNGGSFSAETVSGDMLKFYVINGDVKIEDENGGLSTVTTGLFKEMTLMTDIIVTNLETVPGRSIVQHLGIVQGNTVRAKHVGRDIMAGLKNIVGGELRGYTDDGRSD